MGRAGPLCSREKTTGQAGLSGAGSLETLHLALSTYAIYRCLESVLWYSITVSAQ